MRIQNALRVQIAATVQGVTQNAMEVFLEQHRGRAWNLLRDTLPPSHRNRSGIESNRGQIADLQNSPAYSTIFLK